MKAIVQDQYGPPDVLELLEVDTPIIMDHEVLVRVAAAAVHPGDLFITQGVPYVSGSGSGSANRERRSRGSTWQEQSRRSARR